MSTITIMHGDEVEPEWAYRAGNPKVSYGRYRNAEVDPCPGYPHDKSVAWDVIEQVTALWPNPVPVTLVLLNHEEIGRTNGHSDHARNYYDKENPLDDHHIVLSAKRIPIHPAMTRYLVAHEYGHHVQWWIQQQLGFDYAADHEFERDVYAPLRGLEYKAARPGHWHDATGEVFACDFRLLVTGIEAEYWPHMGVERPDEWELRTWWNERSKADYSDVARMVHDESDN